MRKALVVGIDYYTHITGLTGAVNDANSVASMLERNEDNSVNFAVRLMLGTAPNEVDRQALRDAIEELFKGDDEVALLYFAGHGFLEATGGYLCAGDCKSGNDGVPLSEIMIFANKSKAKNKIIVLDSCHSGIAGSRPIQTGISEIGDDVTVLTASTDEQYASEENGVGVFTALFVNALGGAAANLVGEVTPGGVYAHIDQSLGPWAQRPVFKTNVKRFVSLRKIKPQLETVDLRRICEFFPTANFAFQLDPSFEPERSGAEKAVPLPDPKKTAIFAVLQNYNRVGLLVPRDAVHMWHAAMESKSVRLTPLGEHYRRLVAKKLI